jgi:hypothetical protein
MTEMTDYSKFFTEEYLPPIQFNPLRPLVIARRDEAIQNLNDI